MYINGSYVFDASSKPVVYSKMRSCTHPNQTHGTKSECGLEPRHPISNVCGARVKGGTVVRKIMKVLIVRGQYNLDIEKLCKDDFDIFFVSGK